MGDRILTTRDACHLADVVRAAQGNQPVARLVGDYLVYGTARSIGDERGNFTRNTDDVRDCFLRVTSVTGAEHFWPVSELMNELPHGIFATNYRPPAD